MDFVVAVLHGCRAGLHAFGSPRHAPHLELGSSSRAGQAVGVSRRCRQRRSDVWPHPLPYHALAPFARLLRCPPPALRPPPPGPHPPLGQAEILATIAALGAAPEAQQRGHGHSRNGVVLGGGGGGGNLARLRDHADCEDVRRVRPRRD